MQARKLAIVCGAILAAASATPAAAQATRTWVSGVGDDVNPCSRTAPCKTFAGAISKTAAGGEINCLDPGGFGAVTITKSITIDCTGTFGSILNSAVNGVNVNDSATATPGTINVILRGISINGAGTTPGLNGISFTSGATLLVQDVFIQNQRGGNGMSIRPSGFAQITVINTTITNSGSATGAAFLVNPTGANGSTRVVLDNVRVTRNTNHGVRIDTTGNTSPSGNDMTIVNSEIAFNTNGVSINTPPGTSFGIATVIDSSIFSNSSNALQVAGSANSIIRASGNSITSNGAATSLAGGGTIRSYGDNRTEGNGAAPAFTAPNLNPL